MERDLAMNPSQVYLNRVIQTIQPFSMIVLAGMGHIHLLCGLHCIGDSIQPRPQKVHPSSMGNSLGTTEYIP
jgi:hypothetical protein